MLVCFLVVSLSLGQSVESSDPENKYQTDKDDSEQKEPVFQMNEIVVTGK
jgi:hypothetical protein